MRASVRASFVRFTAPLEGVVPWLYLDVRGLVTIAIGVLVDPIQTALRLPLVRPDGTAATAAEIAAAWTSVKSAVHLAHQGHRAAERVTTLRLTDDGVEQVTLGKVDEMVRVLRMQYPAWDSWPADAQLATLSMAWALGPWFGRVFGHLHNALLRRGFAAAVAACEISTKNNPGIIPRNRENRALYSNAARVVAHGLDPERLWWPATPTLAPADEAPTQPGLPEAPITEPEIPITIELEGPQGSSEGLAEWAIEQHRKDLIE